MVMGAYKVLYSTLDGILSTIETCWCAEPHTEFLSLIQYSRGKNPTYVILLQHNLTLVRIQTFIDQFFSNS